MSIRIFGCDIPATLFPGGEVNVRLASSAYINTGRIAIRANLHTSQDIMTLLMVTDALRRYGTENIYLICPYLPYARQDRINLAGEALGVKVMADLINSQGYESVEVWDCHSDVGLALIDRVVHVPSERFVQPMLLHGISFFPPLVPYENLVLVAPDAGSIKKVAKLSNLVKRPFIRADKKRDVSTGKITETIVYWDQLRDNQDVLIVDDICDGGATFVELAKALREYTEGRIYLYVTHGIFSRGFQVFDNLFERVICANPFPAAQPQMNKRGIRSTIGKEDCTLYYLQPKFDPFPEFPVVPAPSSDPTTPHAPIQSYPIP